MPPVDLSRGAIEARAHARALGHDGGLTGAELIRAADVVLKRAHRRQKDANARRARGKHTGARKLDDAADQELVKAAIQIRTAAFTPLDTGHLHANLHERLQQIRADVERDFREQGSARLAMLTAAQITDQQARQRAERRA